MKHLLSRCFLMAAAIAAAACGPLPGSISGQPEGVITADTGSVSGAPRAQASFTPRPVPSYQIFDPNATPTPPAAGSVDPNASPTPTGTSSVDPGATPTPVPSNAVAYDSTPNQDVTSLFVGGASSATADGTASAAALSYAPGFMGLTLNGDSTPSTSLLFGDPSKGTVRAATLDTGVVTTLTASDPASPNTPPINGFVPGGITGIVYDGTRRVYYVADAGFNRILQMTPTGQLSALAGAAWDRSAGHPSAFMDGPGASATFNVPDGLALVAQTLYVADSGNHCIRAINVSDPTFPVSTFAGTLGISGAASSTPVAASTARFNSPSGLALSQNTLYVADSFNSCIRAIDLGSNQVSVYAGVPESTGISDGPLGAAEFDTPQALAVDGQGNLYVGETGLASNRVRRIDTAGTTTTVSGLLSAGTALGAQGTASFENIYGLALQLNGDGSVQFIYAYDDGPPGGAGRIVKIQP